MVYKYGTFRLVFNPLASFEDIFFKEKLLFNNRSIKELAEIRGIT
jgi:hypothetical protein